MSAITFVDRNNCDVRLIDKTAKNKFKWTWLEEKDSNGDLLADYFSDFRKLRDPGVGLRCNRFNGDIHPLLIFILKIILLAIPGIGSLLNYYLNLSIFIVIMSLYLLCLFQGDPILYHLYGVLVHSGHGSDCGHYYSFVKSPSKSWYCMNDSIVSSLYFS